MNRLTAGAALLAGWLLAAVLAAAPAAAHSMLEESTPAHGTRLATAPEYVALHFSEQVGIDPGHLRVVDADGRRVDRGEAHYAHGRTDHVRVELRPGLGEGSYLASWRVVSADSHPISGTFAFVVGDGPLLAGPAGAGDGTDGTTAALVTATRAVTFGGVVLLGGAVFLALCWPAGWARPAARRVVAAGWLAVTAATLAALALQGPYAAGTGPGDLLSADLLGATADSTFGRLHLARLGALAVLGAVLLRVLRRSGTTGADAGLGVAAGLVVLATVGAAGHAGAGDQVPLAVAATTVHLATLAGWLGGLVLLATLLARRDAGQLAAALPRFSRLALLAVPVIAATGVYLGWREVGTVSALSSTGYGQLLLAKVAVVAVIVAAGNVSRLAVRRRYLMPAAAAFAATDTAPVAEREQDRLLGRLRTSVGLEVGLAAVVLALTAVLAGQPPARATDATPAEAAVALPSGPPARLTVTPARSGPVTVEVHLPGGPGRVSLTAALPGEQLGPLPVALQRVEDGHYRSTGLSLPRSGDWRFELRVQGSEFDADVGGAVVRLR